LSWISPATGQMQVPLRQVTAMIRAMPQALQQPVPPSADEQRAEDVITLANGDTVRGIVSNISAESVTVSAGGNETPVPLDGIRSLSFASTAGPSAKS